MKTRVVVHTVTDYEVTLESNTLEEALDEAKLTALTDGDYSSQKVEWEVLDDRPLPSLMDRVAVQAMRDARKRPYRPFIHPMKRPGTWLK
jgi:hypothetical protein